MRNDVSHAITETGLALIAESGPRAASVRGIADRAGLPSPTLQHHYPTKALLYRAIYAAAVERHCDLSRAALTGLTALAPSHPLSLEGATALLGTWLAKGRAETLVILDLLARAAREADYADLAREWQARTTSVLLDTLRCPAVEAPFLIELLVGLTLTSTVPQRASEFDMLNREVIAHALGDRSLSEHGRWRRLFWEAAPPERGEATAERPQRGSIQAMLDAGVTIMAEAGAEALTYRNIAKRASLSVSSVQHAFPTRSELVLGIYREVRRLFSDPFRSAQIGAEFDLDPTAAYTDMIVGRRAGEAPLVLASCELFLTAAWEEDLARHAWEMRLQRGMLLHDRAVPADFLPHTLSLWTLGLSLVQLSQHHEDPMAAVSTSIASGLALIGAT